MNEQTLKGNFVRILNELGVKYQTINILKNENLDAIIAVKWYEDGRIKLQYREMLADYSENEVKALLKHEACHILTLPSSKLLLKQTYKGEEFFKYVMVYREYLAHREFLKRFGIDENLSSYQRKHFKMYDELVQGCREIWLSKRYHEYKMIMDTVFGIMYDAIYFFVMGDRSFFNWCKKNKLLKLHLLLSWVAEDMQYFYNLKLPEEEKVNLVQAAAVFPLSIDYGGILAHNVIIMMRRVFDKHDPRLKNLATRWLERVKSYGTIQ